MTEKRTLIKKRNAAGFENAEGIKLSVFCENFFVRVVILIKPLVGAAEHKKLPGSKINLFS